MSVSNPQDIIAFWREAGPQKWFTRDDAFDAEIRSRYLATYEAAANGGLSSWEEEAQGTLALTIVLDQFPRNMFRGEARAFASDERARAVAKHALARGFDQAIERDLRGFLYLPLMHSEDLADQETCIALYQKLGNADGLKFAEIHADIIRRFGRFPHRNATLGRETTPDERAFLDAGGFAG